MSQSVSVTTTVVVNGETMTFSATGQTTGDEHRLACRLAHAVDGDLKAWASERVKFDRFAPTPRTSTTAKRS